METFQYRYFEAYRTEFSDILCIRCNFSIYLAKSFDLLIYRNIEVRYTGLSDVQISYRDPT